MKLARILVLLLVIVAAIGIVGSYPGVRGFHDGCSVWEGPQETVTWLGHRFCRPLGETPAAAAPQAAARTPGEEAGPKREDEQLVERERAHAFDERQQREAREQRAREPREAAESEGR